MIKKRRYVCLSASPRVWPVSLLRMLGAVFSEKSWCGFASSISRWV